jgi:hypothetical protein
VDEFAKAERPEEPNRTSVVDVSPSRRRLVRGAASVVPLVLTLRSGTLAAQSFTPEAKTITTLREEKGGKFKLASGSSGLENGDLCYTDPRPGPGRSLSRGKDLEVGSGMRNGAVDVEGGDAFCTGGSYVNGQQVAILSSSAAASLAG